MISFLLIILFSSLQVKDFALFGLGILLCSSKKISVVPQKSFIEQEDEAFIFESLFHHQHDDGLVEVIDFKCGGIKTHHIVSYQLLFSLFNREEAVVVLQL